MLIPHVANAWLRGRVALLALPLVMALAFPALAHAGAQASTTSPPQSTSGGSLPYVTADPAAGAMEAGGVEPPAAEVEATSVAQEAGEKAEVQNLATALKEGDFNVDLRYRYEVVDQDDFDLNAYASTLRTVLNYRTAAFHGFDLFLEAENVAVIGNDNYNNAGRDGSGNGVTNRPVVADPAGTDMNQAYLRYRGYDTSISGGRQEINLRDQRFVGAVGWRQNHQSFDSIWLTNSSLESATLRYGFIGKANRIFRDQQKMTTHLLDGTYSLENVGDISVYGYFIDFDSEPLHQLSTKTFGVELAGSRDLKSGANVDYEFEFAAQRDFGNNPGRVEAGYLHLMVGGGYEGFTVKVGYESLGGNRDDGQFNTPLATLHKFNGWADKFLSTPTNGLRDLYLDIGGPGGPVRWALIFHDFSSNTGGIDYGTEINFQLTYTAPWNQGFGFKGAYYSADEFATDTFKSWLWTTYSF